MPKGEKTMTTAKRNYVRILVECAIMLALSFALSFIGFEMPMGGKVTPASMLPLFLVAIHLGVGSTLITTALYSLLQIWQAYLAGNVFVYCQDGATLALCVIFDYVLPFTLPFIITALFAKLWKRNNREGFIYDPRTCHSLCFALHIGYSDLGTVGRGYVSCALFLPL